MGVPRLLGEVGAPSNLAPLNAQTRLLCSGSAACCCYCAPVLGYPCGLVGASCGFFAVRLGGFAKEAACALEFPNMSTGVGRDPCSGGCAVCRTVNYGCVPGGLYNGRCRACGFDGASCICNTIRPRTPEVQAFILLGLGRARSDMGIHVPVFWIGGGGQRWVSQQLLRPLRKVKCAAPPPAFAHLKLVSRRVPFGAFASACGIQLWCRIVVATRAGSQ